MNITFDLNTIWFALVGILFIGYAVLDGFDLGIGTLHLFTNTDQERRTMLNAIGPVWDGNEVWLVTGGGALFAAFPAVYATVFSGFYLVFILLLFGLIFRAVAIEFRSKQEMKWWRRFWDISFSVSSIISSMLIGIALGNIALGIPLNHKYEYIGSFWGLFNPYAVLVGVTTVALFAMHGSIYAILKTEDDLHKKISGWTRNTMIFFIISYVTTTMVTLLYLPNMTQHIKGKPELFFVPFINMLAVANIPREIYYGRDFRAFLSSCASVIALLVLFGIGLYPDIILSRPATQNSLNIYNAASSAGTLKVMLVIAAIGIPLVLSYTTTIYYIFRGKVRLDNTSY
jgi:cytochrome d ubiquinol oxidase subunit II